MAKTYSLHGIRVTASALVLLLAALLFSGCAPSQESTVPNWEAADSADNYSMVEMFTSTYQLSTESATSKTELTNYIGQTLDFCETSLDIKFQKGARYYVRQKAFLSEGEMLFKCDVDANGRITTITLCNSGKAGYTLAGITSDMSLETVQSTLRNRGLVSVSDESWRVSNRYDGIYLTDSGWTYEKDSEVIRQNVFDYALSSAFQFQFDNSIGAANIGNGQVLEYCADSFAALVNRYQNETEYRKAEIAEEMNGRYIAVYGTVSSVSGSGQITVYCKDANAAEADGKLMPYTADANLNIVSEQTDLLLSITKDSTILAFGRIDSASYSAGFLSKEFTLNDSIIYKVNGNQKEVPVLSKAIPGIQRYSMQGETVVFEEPAEVEVEKLQSIGAYTVEDMIDEYRENSHRARELFMNQCVTLTGRVTTIGADGYTFCLEMNRLFDWDCIKCKCTGKEQKERLSQISNGDCITIQCRVTETSSSSPIYTVHVISFE